MKCEEPNEDWHDVPRRTTAQKITLLPALSEGNISNGTIFTIYLDSEKLNQLQNALLKKLLHLHAIFFLQPDGRYGFQLLDHT